MLPASDAHAEAIVLRVVLFLAKAAMHCKKQNERDGDEDLVVS